mgnify:CR=1 FL=1
MLDLLTDRGWFWTAALFYLAVFIDLYSRMVVGWAMAGHMATSFDCDALTMSLCRRRLPKDEIVHSDCNKYYSAA